MRSSSSSSYGILTFALLLLGCADGRATVVETPGAAPRHAGVAFDPPAHLPDHPSTGQWGALEQPIPRAKVIDVLDAFFAAIAREDLAALATLFTADAETLVSRGSKARALEYWTRRFQRLDYTTQFSGLIYSSANLTIREAADLDDGSAKLQPLLLRPGELVVQVPISPALGNTKLFGKVIEVVLGSGADGYKIRVLREDFELPDRR